MRAKSGDLLAILVTTSVCLVLAGLARAADLIALYGFDTSTTADVAGALKRGAYAGITLNGSVGSGTPTVSGGALVLDGSSTLNLNLSSTVAANPLANDRDWTITFRFKTSTNAADLLVSGSLFMWIGRDGALRMDVWNNYGITSASSGLADGLWHTASLTYLHNPPAPGYPHQFMIVDGGAPVGDNGDATNNTAGAALVTLGLLPNHYDDARGNVKFKGQIDDLAFFQGVLGSNELANVRAGDFSAYVKGGASASLHHFEVTATSQQTIGSPFSVTVTAMDADGMPLTNDSSTLVTMTSSSGNAQFDSDANGTFDDNTKTLTSGTFTIMTKDNVTESLTLTASGGGKTGTSSGITVILPLQAETVTFGTGANQFALTFNPVTPAYRVGNTEILNDAFNKFYLTTKGVAYAGNASLPLTDAACNVSGIEVVDFINWLNTSSGLPAAYTFNADHSALVNWNRTPGAKFFLPTVAEWNGALASISYAFGPCIYEWIQDAAGAGGNLDGVENWRANKSFDESSFIQVYEDTGFRVMSDSSVSLTIQNPFNAWITGAPLTGFTDDPNQDGVANGLAWLLHGTPMGNSRTCLPVATTAVGGKLVLTFQCLKASARGTAVLNVQYSNDLGVLDTWHTAAVPDVTLTVGGVVFTVTPITASDYQTITAEIPLSAASSDGKLFGRLQGAE